MDYANSLDKIGPMTKSIYDTALVLNVIAGYDEKDSTSIDKPKEDYLDYLGKDISGMKIGIIKDYLGEGVDEEIKTKIFLAVEKLKEKGAIISEISLPVVSKYSLAAYYLIALSEASTNLSKYCGIRYGAHETLDGNFNEYFKKVRSMNFELESKRRIILGTFARMSGFRYAYYIRAAKVRTLIIEEYKKMFKEYDILVSPVFPTTAPRFDEIDKMTPLQNYMSDLMTVGPNLAGIPHMSYPVGKDSKGLPIGMMVMADHLEEKKLIMVGDSLEN
jgi:aspartyl-tRNA(Asn)/glutamyl-tRNA(Gln) amidotransferase subunit A